MKRKIATLLILTLLTTLFNGCGNTDTADVDDGIITIDELKNNTFYIRHANDTFDELYFGKSTFAQYDIAQNPSSSKIMWFKEDFENVPTFYNCENGDRLVYYTGDVFDETFTFERFEDLGYTIGLCGMSKTTSGRFSIPTKTARYDFTYPGGDTDEILKLTNETVILDTLGGIEVRDVPIPTYTDDYGMEVYDYSKSFLSRCGTIRGLEQGKSYVAQIYEGTILHEMVFTADVRALGSMEVATTTNYSFVSEKLAEINIPDYFNSGYYMINGVGIMRVVNGSSYNIETDFNVANVVPKNNTNGYTQSSISDIEYSSDGSSYTEKETASDSDGNYSSEEIISTFEINKIDYTNVLVRFYNSTSESGEGLPEITAIIKSPSGAQKLQMPDYEGDETGTCKYLGFLPVETGTYTIKYYNLKNRIPKVTVN